MPRRVRKWGKRFEFSLEAVGTHSLPTLVRYRARNCLRKGSRPKLIIHLHGGPESIERGERRFGDLFPNLVEEGHFYVGWNYPGSAGLGEKWRRAPHGDWESALLREWAAVERKLISETGIPKPDWILVGPSFGGMVALVIARADPSIGRVVLASPLLSLRAQINRVKEFDRRQLPWFSSRFSERDLKRLEFRRGLANLKTSISVISSGRDEVLGGALTRNAVKLAREQGKAVEFKEQSRAAHSPRSWRARKMRTEFLRDEILRESPRPRLPRRTAT